MERAWRAFLAAWAVAMAGVSVVRAVPPDPAAWVVVKAAPAAEWEAKFAGAEGWVGGDVVSSAVLGPRRVLWLFGDSLLGVVRDGGRPGAVMVHNTVGVQPGHGKDDPVRFTAGKSRADRPAALFTPADGKGWFWPQSAVRVGGQLFLFLPQLDKADGPGVLAFKPVGQWLAVVDNPDDDPSEWRVRQHKTPFAEFGPERERSWGSAVLADGEFLYVYGYDERGKGIGKRRLTVARVPAEKADDFAAWRFRTSKGWSERPADAAAFIDGLATEFSVTRLPSGKGYVLVYTENGLGDRVVGRFADAPEGPWSAPRLLYRCPEMAQDKGVFTYAAKAHAWAATGDELVVSYCVNAWEFVRLFRDEKVYRPKFVKVELRPVK